ncbi:MAG TPA: DUF4167 domain-containing protein [Pseudorhizobium sp.]|jgi:rubrerythrin|nr:DUF4167 domain-containing protein [Pseudorhizobium sp.]
MRPGQQNKRGRGRGGSNNNNGGGGNNFNRKGGNPLTRTYDSSGPDVKIRGTAQHIAEKYSTLARDAQSSGDRVIAENYLQHAEHYYRIIAAAQAQMQERFQRDERNEDRDNQDVDENDATDLDDDAGEHQQTARETQQPQRREQQRDQQRQNRREQPAAAEVAPALDGSGPQPVIEGTPAEVAVEEEAQVPAAAQERQPRRRNAGNRPRRPRRGEGEAPAEGEASGQPEMAEVAGE